MHELPITQSVLALTLEHAQKGGGGRVTAVHLVVGDLSRVVDDCVQFYWDILSEGTPAQGAELKIRRMPLEMICRSCSHRFRPGDDDYRCSACGGSEVRVTGGDDLRLEAIDLEPDGSPASGATTPRNP